jgi:hypothetical protein
MEQTAEMYEVIVDGTPWMDPDGYFSWPEQDAYSLADYLESQYDSVDVWRV